MQATRPSQTAPASDGSRTQTITGTPTQPDAAASSTRDSAPSIDGVLRLRGRALPNQRVQWTEGTVDNEFLNRNKSKICCIYHKPKEFDESSDESTDSDSSIGSADSREPNPHRRARRRPHHHHDDHDDGECNHSNESHRGPTTNASSTSETVVELPPKPVPNAYERQPAADKGKRKGKVNSFMCACDDQN
ncbi:type 1 protein phosphatase-activating protein YPI1 [Sporobolomyces koalae]|uniref:type 1 protein phosphatase-activating protein YPI1 n=1 Tax=Sporobolomyces koalae TaxID=500713 RepID=UPI00316EC944